MENVFQKIGAQLDVEIAKFSAWFATQPDEARLLVALVIGMVVGAIVFMFASRILNVLLVIVRLPFRVRSQAVVAAQPVDSPVAAPEIVVPPDHFHKDVRYAVRAEGGSSYTMLVITEQFAAEVKRGSWERFNVSWTEAATFMFKAKSGTGILPPPEVMSRPVQEGESLPPPDLVYLFAHDEEFHLIAAESEVIPDNAMQNEARLVGNKMLRGTAMELSAALRS